MRLNRQVACADVILLNKVDLVSPTEIKSTEQMLHDLNPAVTVHRTIKGEIDLSLVMGISAYNAVPSFQKNTTFHPSHDHENDHDGANDHSHNNPTHYEARGISSLQVVCPVLLPGQLDKLDEWIRTVLWENRLPHDIANTEQLQVLRCKGLFTTQSGEQYVLQGVQNLYEISQVDAKYVTGVPESGKLVLIGKGLTDVVKCSLEDVFH